jgi:hypothetical protein
LHLSVATVIWIIITNMNLFGTENQPMSWLQCLCPGAPDCTCITDSFMETYRLLAFLRLSLVVFVAELAWLAESDPTESSPRNLSTHSEQIKNVRYRSLWRWYINKIIMSLAIIHHRFHLKHNVSETGHCFRPLVKRIQLGPTDRASPSWVGFTWRQT